MSKVEKRKFNLGNELSEKSSQLSQKCIYYKWTIDENIQYILALKELKNQLSHQYHRRSHKVFLQMSKIVGTKTPQQCRTHHQKMIKRFQTIWNIIAFFLQKVESQKKTGKRRQKGARKEQERLAKELGQFLTQINSQQQKPVKSREQITHSPMKTSENIQVEELEFPSPVFQPIQPQHPQIQGQLDSSENIFFFENESFPESQEQLSLNWNIDWNKYQYDIQF